MGREGTKQNQQKPTKPPEKPKNPNNKYVYTDTDLHGNPKGKAKNMADTINESIITSMILYSFFLLITSKRHFTIFTFKYVNRAPPRPPYIHTHIHTHIHTSHTYIIHNTSVHT